MPTTLPTLVPSTAAVESAARRFATDVDPSLIHESAWEATPAYVKNYYTSRALDYINAAAPNLIGDVLEYLVTNSKEFDFSASTVDQLIDGVMAARGACTPSHSDPLAG